LDLEWLKSRLDKDDSQVPLRIKIYDALRLGVIEGLLAPGDELTESQIAAALQLSRTPIREALQRLETEGWVKRVQGRGMVVTDFSEKDVRDLYLMRSVLEGLAVTLALPNLTDDALNRLKWIIDEMELHTSRDNREAVAAKNKEFHWRLVELSGSRHIVAVLRSVYEQIDRVRESSLWVPGRMQKAFEEHLAIYQALAKRDTEHAAELVRQHVVAVGEVLVSRMRTRGITPVAGA